MSEDPLTLVAGMVVVATGAYLVGLAGVALFARPLAERFLGAFAQTARAHYLEQGLRLVAGFALVACAPFMAFPRMSAGLGWVIVITTAGLLLLPWRWHRRFALWVVPPLIRWLPVFALGALALGLFLLHGAARAFQL